MQESPDTNASLIGSGSSETAPIHCNKGLKAVLLKYLRWIGSFISENLLPVGLVLCILFGSLVPEVGVAFDHPATSYVCVIGIFMISGIFMKTADLLAAFKSVRAVSWSLISILFLSCIIGSKLAALVDFTTAQASNSASNVSHDSTLNQTNDMKIKNEVDSLSLGIQLYFIMPCTISSGVVMISQLGGSEILALIITVVANTIAVFTIAPLIKWLIFDARGSSVSLDIVDFLTKSTLQILLPLVIGKCLQFFGPVQRFTLAHKKPIKAVSVLLLVMIAFVKVSAASHDGYLASIKFRDIVVVVSVAVSIHILLCIINLLASIAMRIPIEQLKCVTILCSQKSMAVFVAVLSFLPDKFGTKGILAVAVILSHLGVILFDSILISLWLWIENQWYRNFAVLY